MEAVNSIEVVDPVTATVVDGSAMPAAESVSPPLQADQAASPEQPLGRAEQRDAPYCYQCGNAMQRAGSCYVCASCGTTSGCS